MKKTIIAGLMAGVLMITPVFADTDIIILEKDFETDVMVVEPGITPDNILYGVDTLVEDIQLALTSYQEKKAEIMLRIIQERKAEVDKMAAEDKLEHANKALKGYAKTLEKVQEMIAEIILSDTTSKAMKDGLAAQLDDVIQVVSNETVLAIDEEQKEQLEEKLVSAYMVANVVKGLNVEEVKKLRTQHRLGYGVIAKVFLLADASGKTVDEIAGLITEDKGFGEVAKELGFRPSELKDKGKVENMILTETQAPTEELEAIRDIGNIDDRKEFELKKGKLEKEEKAGLNEVIGKENGNKRAEKATKTDNKSSFDKLKSEKENNGKKKN